MTTCLVSDYVGHAQQGTWTREKMNGPGVSIVAVCGSGVLQCTWSVVARFS